MTPLGIIDYINKADKDFLFAFPSIESIREKNEKSYPYFLLWFEPSFKQITFSFLRLFEFQMNWGYFYTGFIFQHFHPMRILNNYKYRYPVIELYLSQKSSDLVVDDFMPDNPLTPGLITRVVYDVAFQKQFPFFSEPPF